VLPGFDPASRPLEPAALCFSPDTIELLERLLFSKARQNMAVGLPPEGNVGTGEYGMTGDTVAPKVDGHGLARNLPPADRAKMFGPFGPQPYDISGF
jgi:hypothetical protein